MAPSSQRLEPPQNAGRFTLAAKSRIKEREQSRKKSKAVPLEDPF
jgi:hypothetical protein